eukprot:11293426-Prorocentrum_lima.AAC.1
MELSICSCMYSLAVPSSWEISNGPFLSSSTDVLMSIASLTSLIHFRNGYVFCMEGPQDGGILAV